MCWRGKRGRDRKRRARQGGGQRNCDTGRETGREREREVDRGQAGGHSHRWAHMHTYGPSRVHAHPCAQSRTHLHTFGYKHTVTPSDTHTHVHAHRATHTQSHSIVTHTKDRPGEEPEDAGTEPLVRGPFTLTRPPRLPEVPRKPPDAADPGGLDHLTAVGPPLPAAQYQSHRVCWPAPG